MNLADNLKRIRKENHLSQEQLAEKLGVSRQAVSKWESNVSYPEMDKVIQICQLFNLNINELIHENISELSEKKKEKDNISKLIDSFFNYITKVVNLFSSLKFKQIIKCLFEQVVIAFSLFIVFLLIGTFLSSIVSGLLPVGNYYYKIFDVLKSIYILVTSFLGLSVMLHLFKIRYLDYYEIVVRDETEVIKENDESEEEEEKEVLKEQKILTKKPVKIIVRDPKHSEYSFIKGVFKIFLIFVKIIALCSLLFGASMMVFLITCFIISFLIIKSGLLFIAIELGILGCGLILYIILAVLFNFIFNRTSNKRSIFIMFISSLILISLGIGLGSISLLQYEVLEDNNYIETTYEMDMANDLVFIDSNFYGNVSPFEYIVGDNDNVKIVVEHSKYVNTTLYDVGADNRKVLRVNTNYDFSVDLIRQIIRDINNKRIVTYDDYYKVKIYTNEENMQILINNYKNDTSNIIVDLHKQLNKEVMQNNNLHTTINILENYLKNNGYDISYDEEGNLISVNPKREIEEEYIQ